MAFSGFQKTRLGLAAFARGLYGSFAGKTEKTTGKGFGVFSLIDDSGQGLTGPIDATGQGVDSLITSSLGVLSLIDNSGQGLTSLIDTEGKGVESDI